MRWLSWGQARFLERLEMARSWGVTGLVFALGAALSATVFFTIRARDAEFARVTFEHNSEQHFRAIQMAIERVVSTADEVGALFDSMESVSRAQFRIFARYSLRANADLQAVGWIPRVPASRRAAFEAAARREVPGFFLSESSGPRDLSPAAARAEYFPVYYAESRDQGGAPLGYDNGSSADRGGALARSGETGEVVASPRILALGSDIRGRSAIVLFRPVYRKGAPLGSPKQRRDAVLGFTTAVFVINDVIANALERIEQRSLNITLYDRSSQTGERFIAAWPAGTSQEPEDESESRAEMRYATDMPVGGRQWLVIFTPSERSWPKPVSLRAWAVLLAGLIFSLLLGGYLESEQRSARLMREQAITDELTGLYNRRYLLELMPRELARARRYGASLAAVMLDIDHFKEVNDTLGHAAGDVVLREIGQLLRASVRESDVACRFGGEEFVLILPEVSLEDVTRRAEALRLAVAEMHPVHRGRSVGAITISLGIAMFPDDAQEGEQLIRCADIAMYQAKGAGRNRVMAYDASLATQPPAELYEA